jgi:hypothetical protein
MKPGGMCRVCAEKDRYPCSCNANLHRTGEQCCGMTKYPDSFCMDCMTGGCFTCGCAACELHQDGPCTKRTGKPEELCAPCSFASRHGGWYSCTACLPSPHHTLIANAKTRLCKNHILWEKGELKGTLKPLNDEDIDRWLVHGISQHAKNGMCMVCLEDGVDVFSRWNCYCKPSVCMSCMSGLPTDRCLLCRDNGKPFYTLTYQDLWLLIQWDFSKASLRDTMANGYRKQHPGIYNVPVSCLVARSSDVVKALDMNGNKRHPEFAKLQFMALSLVLDWWNIPERFSGVLHDKYLWICGASFDSVMRGRLHGAEKFMRTVV